ncbi:RES family NAD+ phosphorylase [Curtobacterium sp. ODYSSEY 48 V2]|uniref:RES family NAD+ phosphorylase n=1 Tax=Curtobacterium sp. ODYSSEY 48 V2 TaxID=2939561 RepID=UPI00203B56E7|nr:RES family NAD+ phosphorylase [Curtobacterium sp. ODYSSEY 48 V2]MCM3505848.1 RES family NAD+ phosphorylase [Curtobacterium sp. ODYSSEY 48 V2]
MNDNISRNDVAQQPPVEDLDLDGFPDGGHPSDAAFRAHLAEFGPWYFASHDHSRFNLADPNGTCYFADEIETAVREFFGQRIRRNELAEEDVAKLKVSRINPPSDATYAHISGKGAATYGITSELTTMGDYSVTRAWAERLKDVFDGLRYSSRFNPGATSWALFGQAGAAPSLGVEPDASLNGVDAAHAAGIRILPTATPPRKSAVRLIPPP